MPIYEYQCNDCAATFEYLLTKKEETITCEECGSKQVEKQLSTFSTSTATHRPSPCSGGSCPSEGLAGTGCGSSCPHA